MKRLFLAIPIPQSVKEEICQQIIPLNLPLKWMPEKNLHITVHFFGNIEEDKLNDLVKKVDKICNHTSAFTLELDNISVKSGKFQHMIWVKFKKSQAFEDLSKNIAEGFNFEIKRNPLPHINLLRSKNKITSDKLPIPLNKKNRITVPEIQLWESILSSKGSTYFSLKSFILKGEEKNEKER